MTRQSAVCAREELCKPHITRANKPDLIHIARPPPMVLLGDVYQIGRIFEIILKTFQGTLFQVSRVQFPEPVDVPTIRHRHRVRARWPEQSPRASQLERNA